MKKSAVATSTKTDNDNKGKAKKYLKIIAIVLVAGIILTLIHNCKMATDPEYAAEQAQKQADRKAPDTFTFSDIKVSVTRDGESYDIVATISGTVTNEMTRSISGRKMPKLVFDSKEVEAKTDSPSIKAGESSSFTYEMKCQDLTENYEWSFTTPDDGKAIGLDTTIDELTKQYEEVRAEVSAQKAAVEAYEGQLKLQEEAEKAAEEAAKAEEEAQRREEENAAKAAAQEEAKQRHLNDVCYITPTGKKYHESPGCPKLNGSNNLTEMTVGAARDAGYEPCDYCAS